jgi:RNA polymerase sigma factor (sigma-70 family)
MSLTEILKNTEAAIGTETIAEPHASESVDAGAGIANMKQLHTSLLRYCLSLTETTWDAEDLAQDTWVKAVGAFKDLSHSNPEAFLLRIAKNTWIDQARRTTVMTRIIKSEYPKLLAVQSFSDSSFGIETAFQALIKYLSPLQRAVFLLRDVFGYSSLEAAALLRTTEGAVKAALHRARHSLVLVRSDIDEEAVLSISVDEDLKALLRSLTSAYQAGDITTLVTLVQQNEIEAAVAIGMVQNRQLHNVVSRTKTQSHSIDRSILQLAA